MALPLPADAANAMEPDRPAELMQSLARAKRGDLAAFEQLLVAHERMVLRVAQRLLGNTADAQDAAQEVFLRLYRALQQFDEAREFAPWLYRVTVNVCRDWQRRQARLVPLETAGDPPLTHNHEQEVSREQEKALLQRALSRLPERERAAVVLRHIEGLSTADVAHTLGTTEATVRSQISSGRGKLREYLRALGRRR